MGRTLRYLGLGFLAGAIWLQLGVSTGWVTPAVASTWTTPCFLAGVLLFGTGLLLGFLGPMLRRLSGGRCVRCGAPTGRGQAYCWDHLQETVNQGRERSRNQVARNGRGA
jgi:hypothetical protein